MKSKKKSTKENINNKAVSKPSVEYTTEELIELGKKLNILKLAPPLYEDRDKEEKEQD